MHMHDCLQWAESTVRYGQVAQRLVRKQGRVGGATARTLGEAALSTS